MSRVKLDSISVCTFQLLLKILRGAKLPDLTGQELLELTSALLRNSYSRMMVETTSKLIPQV